MKALPVLVQRAGGRATKRFIEFFAAQYRNRNTREAYARAVSVFFDWCEASGTQDLGDIEPLTVAAYIELLETQGLPASFLLPRWSGRGRPPLADTPYSKPTVKQHLAAIRKCFDWLVTGGILSINPAASVQAPKYRVTKGLTPVLSDEEARQLFRAIPPDTPAGVRDRALVAVMLHSFARIGAVVSMNVEDYFYENHKHWFRLHEKNSVFHAVPAHHTARELLEKYLEVAGIADQKKTPLFRSVSRRREFTESALTRNDALRMCKRRARDAGLEVDICNHSFRATGITNFVQNGGDVDEAQKIAAHADKRTTALYVRTQDEITLDEIERIRILSE